MNLKKCLLTANRCYKTGFEINPVGIMVHSTGANNPNLRRYVQPSPNDPYRAELLKVIGVNNNHNSWQRDDISVCVHAFIGKLADGSIATAQTLPWSLRGWHAGSGTSGKSANNTHISFEICEDGLTDAKYFQTVMTEAMELCAHLCKVYGFDPLKDGVLISHHEGYVRGIASNHGDIDHWLKRHGKTMDWFRQGVKNQMEQSIEKPHEWAMEAWEWAKEKGITDGTRPRDMCSREELVTMLYRAIMK